MAHKEIIKRLEKIRGEVDKEVMMSLDAWEGIPESWHRRRDAVHRIKAHIEISKLIQLLQDLEGGQE